MTSTSAASSPSTLDFLSTHTSPKSHTFVSPKHCVLTPSTSRTNTIPPQIIHSQLHELQWVHYAAVQSALQNLAVNKVKIWVPENEQLPGEMWQRIARLPNVIIQRVPMPNSVWGISATHPAHQSDLARIRILWEEGGIYVDTDIVALKSSDDIIFHSRTKSTVMPLQSAHFGRKSINALIMSKSHSPFLARWMEKYKKFEMGEWDHISCWAVTEMYDAGEPDLQLLDDKAWMYPMPIRLDDLDARTDPNLATAWLGKSWFDIDESYGLHFWKWKRGFSGKPFPLEITPEAVRTIDTPLFCRMRKLFDNIDGDEYFSVPWEEDSNCAVSWTMDLREDDYRLFADWNMRQDDLGIKWVDKSGHRNHGWAFGTALTPSKSDTNGREATRYFNSLSHAWLPVPADWDTRVGTARMKFQLDSSTFDSDQRRDEIGLLKIRMDYAGEILFGLKILPSGLPHLTFSWLGTYLTAPPYDTLDNVNWTSPHPLPLSVLPSSPGLTEAPPTDLAITFDRLTTGTIAVYINGKLVANTSLPLLASPKLGNEIWVNAREWDNLDTGFRGSLHRLSFFADVVPADAIARPIPPPIPGVRNTSRTPAPSAVTRSPDLYPVYISILVLGLLVACFRRRARIVRLLKGVHNPLLPACREKERSLGGGCGLGLVG